MIALQADWQRTYAALAVPPPVHATALRRRLYALSGQLLCHPYWSSPPRLPGARVELGARPAHWSGCHDAYGPTPVRDRQVGGLRGVG
ncbi:hypothetical protein OG504_00665 [Streptomyces sp. NBC_00986]|nr:hypothetical protein OG504_00665 [Streptomyces sp. NBC_00986]